MEGDIDSRYIRLAVELMLDVSPVLLLESRLQEKILRQLQSLFQNDSSMFMVSSKNWNSRAAKSDITVYTMIWCWQISKSRWSYAPVIQNQKINVQNIGYFIKLQQSRTGERAPMLIPSNNSRLPLFTGI